MSTVEFDGEQCCNEVVAKSEEAGAPRYSPTAVGDCATGEPILCLSDIGAVVEKQLQELPVRFPNVRIDEYVIMPNYIHLIVFVDETENFSSSSCGLNDVVRVFKSLASRECKANFQIDGLFQRSYYDHLIKDKTDYEKIVRYIKENPKSWFYDRYYNECQNTKTT